MNGLGVDLSHIEQDDDGYPQPALLRRAVFAALGSEDKNWSALKSALEERGIALPSTTDPERLFANAKDKEHWAKPISQLLGTGVESICRVRRQKRSKRASRSVEVKRRLPEEICIRLKRAIDRDGGADLVARRAGVSKGSILAILRGIRVPSFSDIALLCRALDIDIRDVAIWWFDK